MYSAMSFNVDEANHIYLSLTRTYMSLLMVSPMALIMLLVMGKMYPNKKLNGTPVLSALQLYSIDRRALQKDWKLKAEYEVCKLLIIEHQHLN